MMRGLHPTRREKENVKKVARALLWNPKKFYECVPRRVEEPVEFVEFPVQSYRLSLAAYVGPRYMMIGDDAGAVFVKFGVIAICSMATS